MNQANTRASGAIVGGIGNQQFLGAPYDAGPAQRAQALHMALSAAAGSPKSVDDLIASAKRIDAYLRGGEA
jgi:hypothetical protein